MLKAKQLTKLLAVAALILSMTACGEDEGTRALTGGGIGAGVGVGAAVLGAPLIPAVLIGGAIGAATGAATTPSLRK